LDEQAGTEFIFLVTSAKQPITLDRVRSVWPGAEPLGLLPDYTVARIESGTIRFEHFGKGFGPIIQHDDPETVFRRRLEPMLTAIERELSGIAGIAFTHKR
jgi:hypothetical protein